MLLTFISALQHVSKGQFALIWVKSEFGYSNLISKQRLINLCFLMSNKVSDFKYLL